MSSIASVYRREDTTDAQPWSAPDVTAHALVENGAWHPRTLRQLEETEQRAHEEGYRDGLAAGRAAAREELAVQVRRIDAIVQALQAPLDELDEVVERELLNLAMIAAGRIAFREISLAPERVLDAVRAALKILPGFARQVRIRLHADDAALVRGLLSPTESGHAVEIVEDDSLVRGGCIVQAENSEVDVRFETRIAAVFDDMLGRDAGRDEGEPA
ncbi:MAG TPA: FliH/SctL family protein [Dokdonella sp.]|nr:FliH/SctL family protein [Dokdonella sp.]